MESCELEEIKRFIIDALNGLPVNVERVQLIVKLGNGAGVVSLDFRLARAARTPADDGDGGGK